MGSQPCAVNLLWLTSIHLPYRIERGNSHMTYSQVIGKRIKELCGKHNITVNRLATLSGITQSTLDNIVKGNSKNPSIRTLHRIAVGLNMTVSELLDFPEMNNTIFEDE